MDMKNVFLHGELDREIYMNQPNEFENGVEDIWMQLDRSCDMSKVQSIMVFCTKEVKTTS